MSNTDFSFQQGVYHLNDQSNFDFQLNRLIMWDGGDLEEVRAVSHSIRTSEDWKRTLITLGDRALSEDRVQNAIGYYRMSEFFMYDGDPDKRKYYDKATVLFYEYYASYFSSGTVERFSVPYEDGSLPVLHAKAVGPLRDTIVLHGGNDSYFEEFFLPMLYLAQNGFAVYLFEGPGQGGVMRVQGMHFTHEWERPVKAILDYFDLADVTVIGASLGGMLAPRAAAFEPRIRRVIAWSVFPDFQQVLLNSQSPAKRRLCRLCLRLHLRPVLNFAMRRLARSDELIRWGLRHGMYAYQAKSPYDYIVRMHDYQMLDIAERITQDVLIVGASRDHFIDYTTVGEQIAALKNVRSLTFRLFTEQENACNHCNCGNVKLTLDTFMHWIDQIKEKEATCQ